MVTDRLSEDLASLRIARDEPPERASWTRPVVGAAVALAVVGGAYALGAPYVEAKLFRPVVEATEIAVVSPAQSSVEVTATGYVVAESKSKVGSKAQGRIARLLVKEGDVVEAGQLVAELDASDQESAIRTARARVKAARARVLLARATLEETRVQAERQKALADRHAAPKAIGDDLELRARALEASAHAAEADLASAEAEVDSLNVTLRDMRVLAPIAGRVIDKPTDVGEQVVPGQTPIVQIADFDSLVVEVDVPENRLYKVKAGTPCEVILDAYPDKRWRCAAKEIIPRVNRAKATVPVKVEFVGEGRSPGRTQAGGDVEILPDMAARVSFLSKALDAASVQERPHLVVPAAAVTERNGDKVVFVLDGDTARVTPVTLGPAIGGGFEVVRGPSTGTRVVKDPPGTLEDGQRVKERSP